MNPIIPNEVIYLYIILDKVIGLAWLLMILSMLLFLFHMVVYMDYDKKSGNQDIDVVTKYNYDHGKKIRLGILIVFVISIIMLTILPGSKQFMLLILNNYMTPDTLNSLSDNGKDILNEYINIIKSGIH